MRRLSYLAYGSNLHLVRLARRAPSARALVLVELEGWSLRFHKRGRDGSGKCNLLRTGLAQDAAYGVLYEIAASDKLALDRAEGPGYREAELEIAYSGKRLRVFTYLARGSHVEETLKPFDWYKALVLAGARAHGMPVEYLRAIEQIEERLDSSTARVQRYRSMLLQG